MQPVPQHYLDYIEKLYREGFTITDIAKITRLSRQTIHRKVSQIRARVDFSQGGEKRGE